MAGKRPYDISAEHNPVVTAAFNHFGRHLVSLVFRADPVESDKKPRFLGISGQILSVRGKWCLLTAGHIVEDLEKLVKSHREKVQFFLADYFGAPVLNPVPYVFDYESAPKYFMNQDGVDFGLIAVRPYYENLLRADGIIPIEESNWIHQHSVQCDEHLMMGFPTDFMETEIIRTNEGYQINGGLTPTMMRVRKLDKAPANAPPSKYPQFIGQLGDGGVGDIDGMSGCPIFGFDTKQMGRYWVVAVQSSWLPQSRIVFATPVPVVGTLIEEILQAAADEL